jgi:hypothetical protein
MMILRCAALVIALAGCSRVLGFKEVTAGDGGTDPGADSSTDAAMPVAPPNTVVGRIYTRCHQPSGDIELPTDLSKSILQALIFEDSRNAYRTVEGAGKADGTFRIDGVPDGVAYIFRFGTSYFVTDQHVIEHWSELVRRCVPVPAVQTIPTSISWNLIGMTPFHVGVSYSDDIVVQSLAVAYQSFELFGEAPGVTAFNPRIDWSSGTSNFSATPLVDATEGDDLSISHVRYEALPDASFGRKHTASRLVDLARLSGITVRDGMSTQIPGAFQQLAANKTVSFTVDRAPFEGGYRGTTRAFGFSAWIIATPAPDDTLRGIALASFDLNDLSRNTSLRQAVTNYRYADPFPDSWKRYSVVEYGRFRSFRLPGTSTTSNVTLFSRQVAEYAATFDVAQQLQPPGNARIGGVDFEPGGKVAFDGTSPVEVVWSPVLSARSYRLSVSRVTASGRESIASFRTTGTSLKIPAEMFVAGQFYMFVLGAARTPNDYQGGQIQPSGLPSQIAEVPSGVFRLSSECGDGVVKSGEEACDTRGETAACDVDCTLPECGDGLRNAAAGEACDSGGADTPGCNADCTLPVCGDDHPNLMVEDCDDGNAVDDGNGCSKDCKFNNVCGNAHVESLVEECDPGFGVDTASCDSDCTRVVCGDEHVNAAAGEECDDGPANGLGRCSAQCKLITP